MEAAVPSHCLAGRMMSVVGAITLFLVLFWSCPVVVSESTLTPGSVNETLYWGTYRSNLYFGTRARSPESPLVGLMWLSAHKLLTLDNVRHQCQEGDGLDSYGWVRHDGTSFGEQVLIDSKNGFKFNTTYLKHVRGERGGEWVTRISAEAVGLSSPDDPAAVSLFFYIAVPDSDRVHIAGLSGTSKKKGLAGDTQIEGATDELGPFSLIIRDVEENTSPSNANLIPQKIKGLADLSKTHFYGYKSRTDLMWDAKRTIVPLLTQERQRIMTQYIQLRKAGDPSEPLAPPFLFHPTLPNTVQKDSNVIVVQKAINLPFKVDLIFVSHSAHPGAEAEKPKVKRKKRSDSSDAEPYRPFTEDELQSWALTGSEMAAAVTRKRQDFEARFEEAFGLAFKGFNEKQRDFAMSTMSNLIGGISYFHGESIVRRKSPEGKTVPYYTPAQSLYTAVPSRPFFPRGFLWDEGFHQLLVRQWNPIITRDVLRYWFALQDPETGWIAREQILGAEARSKVPEKFQAQEPSHANPPTLLFPLSASIKAIKDAQAKASTDAGVAIDPSSINSLSSFGTAQTTDVADELSFLQDSFPRLAKWYEWWMKTQTRADAVDSFQWTGRTLNHTLTSGLDDYPRAEIPSAEEEHVDLLSWMMFFSRTMADIAQLIGQDPSPYTATYTRLAAELPGYWSDQHKCYCDANGRDNSGRRNLVCHKGYISLFPLLLGLVPTDSPNLGALLDLIRDEEQLWSGYGIRSLSKSDRYFGRGENYWKGPIWINVNYLILSSLKHYYASRPGPYQARAQDIYRELRNQIVTNMYNEYVETGYVWEQYNPITGKGQRSHPFTGWSALVVLIMAEHYPEKYSLTV